LFDTTQPADPEIGDPHVRVSLLQSANMRKPTVRQFVASVVLFLTCSTILDAASRTACDLLDAQVAASLAGGKVDAPMNAGFLCIYAAEANKIQVMFSLTDASTQDADSFIQAHGGAKQGDTYESIPGLPSKNLLVVTSYQKHSLTVFARGKELNLIVGRPMTPELKDTMIQVMKRLLGKL
jgi:hypothetical protein